MTKVVQHPLHTFKYSMAQKKNHQIFTNSSENAIRQTMPKGERFKKFAKDHWRGLSLAGGLTVAYVLGSPNPAETPHPPTPVPAPLCPGGERAYDPSSIQTKNGQTITIFEIPPLQTTTVTTDNKSH